MKRIDIFLIALAFLVQNYTAYTCALQNRRTKFSNIGTESKQNKKNNHNVLLLQQLIDLSLNHKSGFRVIKKIIFYQQPQILPSSIPLTQFIIPVLE